MSRHARGWGGVCAALVVVCLPRAARAAEPPELGQAVSAYEAFDYPKALELLDAAAKAPNVSRKDQARVQVFRGVVLFTLGKREEADQAFAAALEFDPRIEPPPATSPKISARFFAVRREREQVRPEDDTHKAGTGPLDQGQLDKSRLGEDEPGKQKKAPVHRSRSHTGTWISGSIGALALAAGIGAHFWANKVDDDFAREPWADRAQTLKDKSERLRLGETVAFATAGAATVAAIVFAFVEGGGERATPERTTLSIVPGGIELQVRF